MQKASAIITPLNGILLVISTGFQLLALLGGVLPNSDITTKYPWLVTGWVIALSLLVIAFVLDCILKEKGKWPLIPLILSLLGGFLALLTALTLKDAFPTQIGSDGSTVGLTIWRLCYRHLSSVLVGALTALTAAFHLAENRRSRIRRENEEYRSIYDLSGEPLFKDNSTIGLDYYADDDGSGPKPKRKRSLRLAEKKRKAAALKEAAAHTEE